MRGVLSKICEDDKRRKKKSKGDIMSTGSLYSRELSQKLGMSKDYLCVYRSYNRHLKNYEEAYNLLQSVLSDENPSHIGRTSTKNTYHVDLIQDKGKAIYQYLCVEAKQSYENRFSAWLVEPHEILMPSTYKFTCINKEKFNPINFGIDYHSDGYDGACCFHYDGKTNLWRFSLYNDNGEVDCSKIAKQYGGGGHKGAAGFVLSPDDFNRFMATNI